MRTAAVSELKARLSEYLCASAISRRRREGLLRPDAEPKAKAILSRVYAAWSEVQPCEVVRRRAKASRRSSDLMVPETGRRRPDEMFFFHTADCIVQCKKGGARCLYCSLP